MTSFPLDPQTLESSPPPPLSLSLSLSLAQKFSQTKHSPRNCSGGGAHKSARTTRPRSKSINQSLWITRKKSKTPTRALINFPAEKHAWPQADVTGKGRGGDERTNERRRRRHERGDWKDAYVQKKKKNRPVKNQSQRLIVDKGDLCGLGKIIVQKSRGGGGGGETGLAGFLGMGMGMGVFRGKRMSD